jgi:hypothetical protein
MLAENKYRKSQKTTMRLLRPIIITIPGAKKRNCVLDIAYLRCLHTTPHVPSSTFDHAIPSPRERRNGWWIMLSRPFLMIPSYQKALTKNLAW